MPRGSTHVTPGRPASLDPRAAPAASSAAGSAARLERSLLARLHRLSGEPPLQLQLWDGFCVGPAQAPFTIELLDRGALYRLLRSPNIGLGEMYSAGRLRVHGDLSDMLVALYRHITPARAAMQYTCAYFETPELSLEQAQLAKLEHVCRKLRLRPGQQVIEAGSGWGGLARYMAQHHGVSVRAFNISREQIAWAREQAAREGLADRVEYIEDDYRNITGRCDAFVSVGMLEHVGPDNYDALAGVIRRTLKADGIGLVHSIGRDRPGPVNGWIEKHIFPGTHVPSITEFMRMFEHGGFSVLDVENLRLHYARTLEHWRQRFDAAREELRADYDDEFVRAWELYLAGARAGFVAGTMQLFQVVFAPAGSNALPQSRRDLYASPAAPADA